MAEERRDRGQGRPEGGRQEGGRQGGKPEGGKQGGRGRFGRRRFKGGQGAGQDKGGDKAQVKEAQAEARPKAPEIKLEDLPKPDPVACPICGKPVYDLSTALCQDREHPSPAHFDCVIERVMAAETLGPGEKLVYLGSGAFGVVEFKDKSESIFTVKRRIQWEKEGEKQDWRKLLSSRISNL